AEPEQKIISAPEQTISPEPKSEPETQKATFPPKETTPPAESVLESVSESISESKPESELSEILYSALSQYQETVQIQQKIDPNELEQAVNIIERTHPEIFWISGYSMRYNSQSAEISFQIINQYSSDQLRQMADELERTVQEILRTIDPALSDVEKIRKIHDNLVLSTEYDFISAQSSRKDISNSAYGCLVSHKAICQGYAQAFQLLLNRLGMECGICSGIARNQPHAWNYVLLNQKYYWIDVTWDDPVKNAGDPSESAFPEDWISHDYFLLDDATLHRTRTFDEDNVFIPVCDSLEENEFVRSGNYLESYSFSEMNQKFTEHVSDGRLEIMFRTEEAYQACLQNLFTENHIWDAEIFQSGGGQIHYQQDPDLYILRFLFTVH
ncbi:MAG: hypothetical protein K2H82_03640, partial [Oscillospiraceae bacterium]|nr:hypothetical protein [Oscillospiraceae bacterium]